MHHAKISFHNRNYLEFWVVCGANFYEAILTSANLEQIKNAVKARYMDTVRVEMGRGDVIYYERRQRRWTERWLDWEWFRTIGRLPLFTASYAVLIVIPLIFYGLALYNSKIEIIRTWADHVAPAAESPMHSLAVVVKERLHLQPIPTLSFVLLMSTVLLAIGSTLYTSLCPSRVKEFSRDQWCDQLGRSLIHYWPLAWKYPWARVTCALCYGIGGIGALCVIALKVAVAGWFIIQNSSLPWPLK